jgi:hypothetical protein
VAREERGGEQEQQFLVERAPTRRDNRPLGPRGPLGLYYSLSRESTCLSLAGRGSGYYVAETPETPGSGRDLPCYNRQQVQIEH